MYCRVQDGKLKLARAETKLAKVEAECTEMHNKLQNLEEKLRFDAEVHNQVDLLYYVLIIQYCLQMIKQLLLSIDFTVVQCYRKFCIELCILIILLI